MPRGKNLIHQPKVYNIKSTGVKVTIMESKTQSSCFFVRVKPNPLVFS